jgi:hypothetical protein
MAYLSKKVQHFLCNPQKNVVLLHRFNKYVFFNNKLFE